MFLFACSSDSTTETNNADQPIIPSNLTFDINIFGQSNSNPNGDGSGLITCVATATDAVSYEFRLGDGVAINSTDGEIDYTFTSQGTNSYTVYVYAYSSTGHYISSFLSFDLFVEIEDNQATWSEEFNNDGPVNADIWTHEIGNGDGGWGNGESQYYTNSLTNSFVDDVLYYTYSPSPQDSENWPFNQEMFFILNVAMGGHWFDIDPEFSESTMEVDYIRIYQ